ncbi:MAG: protoporphyrinogen oxidase, partial [candidate division Zixibacteria bacterium]|nr:protoporphyrinogen oxidase [candidate division Zixibacteria bacterium]
IFAGQVILAVPSYRAADIVTDLSRPLAELSASIRYAPISVVCEGYLRSKVRRNLDGFGFLAPPKEGRRILGSIWTSSIFENRAPNGYVQFRTMIGGDGDHDSMMLSDEELVGCVRADLNSIIGLDGPSDKVRVFRWRHGIPQFKVGHSGIVSAIEEHLRTLGNIHITGNAYYGIGLNDCVKQSYRVVDRLQQ